jgi:hypothetical protein
MEHRTPRPPEEVQQNRELEKQIRNARISELVEAIHESGESLPFPGIPADTLTQLRDDDEELLAMRPGSTTPIDQILERLMRVGMKLELGPNPDAGNVFVLPADSDDIDMDSIQLSSLDTTQITDPKLLELIQLKSRKR